MLSTMLFRLQLFPQCFLIILFFNYIQARRRNDISWFESGIICNKRIISIIKACDCVLECNQCRGDEFRQLIFCSR